MTCFSDLIGVEFAYGGRGPDSYDCWGLVKECYRRWHGQELPDYRWTNRLSENAEIMSASRDRDWTRLEAHRPGAVLLIRVKGFGAHVGFQHSPTRFLQTLESHGVMQSRLTVYRNQIIGAYLYAGHDRPG